MNNKIKNSLSKVGSKINHRSPEILATVGVIGIVGSAVLACRQTLKVNNIVKEKDENIKKIHEVANMQLDEYSEKDIKKDTAITYANMALKITLLYAPSVILGGLSIGCMLKSNDILKKRNVVLAAAYTSLDKGFKEYRGRVVDRFGKELDKELLYNVKAKEFTTTDEKGKEKKEVVDMMDPNSISEFARFFDDGQHGWTKDPEKNLAYLKMQQNYCNELLKSRGHLFLNEVYDVLGYDRTRIGQTVGWIYDENCPNGDNFVDFNIYNGSIPSRNFVNGYERTILLDFNVDGIIIDSI